MKKKKTLIIVIIAAAVLVGVMLLLIFLPKGSGSDSSTVDEGVAMKTVTDKDGMHQAVVETEPNGEIKNNSYGTLIKNIPADIKTIHVENKKGTLDVISNTPKGEATVYKLKGYEDYALQSGIPDKIANAAAKLDFSKVASQSGDKKSEFGLDEPRATVTVTYNDKTKAKFIVGSDAPQSAGTYIQFGTEPTIYLCDTETVSAFDLGLNDFMDLNINKTADTTENNDASSITISGSGFDSEIVLKPNKDGKNAASFVMTSPSGGYANESEASLISGGIRGLYADSVEMVDPSDDQLKKLGLFSPHAKITAVYPDTTVKLIGSKPDGDGKVYIMTDGGKVVYKLSSEKAAWTATSYVKLLSDYVISPKMDSLSAVSVKTDKTYDFSLETKTSTKTDDQGSETTSTTTTVQYNGKDVDLGKFTTYYDDLSLIKLSEKKSKSFSGSPEISVTYTYSDGTTDKAEFYAAGNEFYTAVLNGKAVGSCYKADVVRIKNNIKDVIK